VRVCLRWTVPATTDITDDPRQCVTNEADAIRGMPDLTKSDQRQVTRARVMDSLVHVASSRSRGGAGNLVREPDGAEIGRHTIDQVTPPGVGRRADVWTSASLSPARVSSMVCGCSVTFIRHAEHGGPSPCAALSGWRGESSGAD
jgi:hypothetical protein